MRRAGRERRDVVHAAVRRRGGGRDRGRGVVVLDVAKVVVDGKVV